MINISYIITRKDQGTSEDDRIDVREFNESGLYRVTYSTPEFRRSKTFVATESQVLDYLEDVLFSLSRDTEPFDRFQLNTCIHPPVMYHVADLYEDDVRRMIMNMSRDAVRLNVADA